MLQNLNDDIIQYIIHFLFQKNSNCLCDISPKSMYYQFICINHSLYDSINKHRCRVNFRYFPCNNIPGLLPLLECTTHFKRRNNKIDIINDLNEIKSNYLAKRYIQRDLKLQSKKDCRLVMHYLQDFYPRVHAHFDRESNTVSVIDKLDRVCGFL